MAALVCRYNQEMESRYRILSLSFLILFTIVPLAFATDTITVQLKWLHQFQFAGYYAAIEKGYYKVAGMDVRLVEAQKGQGPIETVLQGKADYGVGTSDLILHRSRGEPVVALAVIFQHSPLILLARKDSSIRSVRDLENKPVMIEPDSAELFAYLKKENVPVNLLDLHEHAMDPSGLISGEFAAMSAYSTDEPFVLKKDGVEYEVFSPRSAGIDFYGDNLFTTEQILQRNPERTRAFVDATLSGWKYAMEHPDEIIDLILRQYSQRKTRDQLQFEAEEMRKLIHAGTFEIGSMDPKRWEHIEDTYSELGMMKAYVTLDDFLYYLQ